MVLESEVIRIGDYIFDAKEFAEKIVIPRDIKQYTEEDIEQ